MVIIWLCCLSQGWHDLSDSPIVKANTKQSGLILLIDAQATARQERRDVLERDGLRVEEATDAREGLSLARLLRPEVILCARRVGEVNGEELLRLLDEEWENGGAWAFVFLGEDADEDRLSLLWKRDADAVLAEDTSDFELIETVRKYLEQVADWRAAEERAEARVQEVLEDWEACDSVEPDAILDWEEETGAARHGRIHSNQIAEVAKETVARLGRTADLECFIDQGFLPFPMETLRAVVDELIGNACRFTTKGTRIDLFFIRGADRSVLFVRDYGTGMEAAMAVRLTAGWDADGKGKGLLRVRRLVREAGASFRIDGGVSEGVTVRIEIPDEEGRATLPMSLPEDMKIPHLRIELPRKSGRKG